MLNNKNDIILEEKIMKLGDMLSTRDYQGRIKYNSIKDKDIIKLTKEIKNELFNNNSVLKEEYKNFKNKLEEMNEYFKNISLNNNIDYIDNTLSKNKEKYINNYIMNSIVNHANYKKKITEEEVIQNIVKQNYKQNKNNRYSVLLSFLSNKSNKTRFKNSYKIRQAVKNINDELEEAQKEFDKLFITNEVNN